MHLRAVGCLVIKNDRYFLNCFYVSCLHFILPQVTNCVDPVDPIRYHQQSSTERVDESLFPEAKSASQVEFYIFIATMVYLFLTFFLTFYIFYKIAMISGHRKIKNVFLFLMSLLLRIPFQPVESIEKTKLTFRGAIKEVYKEIIIVVIVTLWYVIGLFIGYHQILDFR
ncbi:hypothetical protein [Halobacillus litoralis]|uniref:hypothetical protein n=1 Tax=Halobacillus litoralis TaxID=45668 RepID=UPI001CFCDB71|nr:hypothetical protein [Halobacillus litoralis]